MRFRLRVSEQFGPNGPQAGDEGLTSEADEVEVDDEPWFRTRFEGHEGIFFLPEYMMEWI